MESKMSDFEEAYHVKCPYCKQLFASCEGPLCNCAEVVNEAFVEMFGNEEDEDKEGE